MAATIEADEQFWVRITVDNGELPRRGPFASKTEAAAAAERFGAICRAVLHQPVAIGVVQQTAARDR